MASSTTITAHVVVEFAAGSDNPTVSVEVDGREDGYNNGKTSFFPGENAYLLLYVPAGWSCKYFASSAGALTYIEDTDIAVEDYLAFVDDETAQLQYTVSGYPVFTWLGNNLGTINLVNGVCSLIARAFDALTKVFTPAHRVGIAKVNYVTRASVYRVSSVPVSVAKVLAMFVVTKDT